MGFRCSLLGHTFDETDVRRDREVRGDEVVTVVETVERCSKCGTERVVSENKEVVSVVDADDVDLDEADLEAVAEGRAPGADATDPTEGGPSEAERWGPDGTDGTDQGDEADQTPEAGSGVGADTEDRGDDAGTGQSTGAGTDPTHGDADTGIDADGEPDPDEEDVEFITETEGSLGGGDEVDVDVDGEAPSGGIGGMAARSGAFGGESDSRGEGQSDPGESAASPDEDAEILDEVDRRERAPGQWPDDPDAEREPWTPEPLSDEERAEADEERESQGETREQGPPAEPAPDVGSSSPSTDAGGGALACPSCGHRVSGEASFRAGDACPECRTDYLEPAE